MHRYKKITVLIFASFIVLSHLTCLDHNQNDATFREVSEVALRWFQLCEKLDMKYKPLAQKVLNSKKTQLRYNKKFNKSSYCVSETHIKKFETTYTEFQENLPEIIRKIQRFDENLIPGMLLFILEDIKKRTQPFAIDLKRLELYKTCDDVEHYGKQNIIKDINYFLEDLSLRLTTYSIDGDPDNPDLPEKIFFALFGETNETSAINKYGMYGIAILLGIAWYMEDATVIKTISLLVEKTLGAKNFNIMISAILSESGKDEPNWNLGIPYPSYSHGFKIESTEIQNGKLLLAAGAITAKHTHEHFIKPRMLNGEIRKHFEESNKKIREDVEKKQQTQDESREQHSFKKFIPLTPYEENKFFSNPFLKAEFLALQSPICHRSANKAIYLQGDPGSSKTYSAKLAATGTGRRCFPIPHSATPRQVEELFSIAKQEGTCVILLDELPDLLTQKQMFPTLKKLLEQEQDNLVFHRICIIATGNKDFSEMFPDSEVDATALESRFETIHCSKPDADDRKAHLEKELTLKKIKLEQATIDYIIEKTDEWNHRDLQSFIDLIAASEDSTEKIEEYLSAINEQKKKRLSQNRNRSLPPCSVSTPAI